MSEESPKKNRSFKGQWVGFGLCIGIAIGMATNHFALWLCIGLALGAAIEARLSKKK